MGDDFICTLRKSETIIHYNDVIAEKCANFDISYVFSA